MSTQVARSLKQRRQRRCGLVAQDECGYRRHERLGRGAYQGETVLEQDPAGVGPVAVVVPLQSAVTVVVEQPLAAQVID